MKKQNSDTHIPAEHDFDCGVQDLLRLAQEGSHEAYLCLRAKYRPLLEASVARFGTAEMTDQERTDMKEEAERVFLGAVTTFETDQEAVDFGLYAKICITNALLSQLRIIRRYRSEISMGDAVYVGEVGEDPAARVMQEEAAAALYARVRSLLSPYENRVWSLYMAGRSVGEIARLLQKDTHSIENAVYRIRKKLRAALEGGLRD